jgi:hypothetical protein
MATFTAISDITKPMDTSGWKLDPSTKAQLTTEQLLAMEAIQNMDIDLISANEGKRKDSNNPGEKEKTVG